MRRPRPALNLPATLAAVCCFAVVALAATTTLVVYPGHLEGWQPQTTPGSQPTPAATPAVLFVFGPATPPAGRGSAELRVGSDGSAAAQLRQPNYAGTLLPNPTPAPPAANELSALSYSTFVQQDGSGGQAPYIILQIDTDGDAGIEDLLFFEPVYQSATFCPANPQPALVVGQWQTWDAFNGCWYSVFGTGGSGPGTNVKTLRQLSAALPTGKIANSSPSGLGGVRLVAGFGAGAWDNFVGNADAFQIGVGPDTTVYDFEPQAPPAPATGGVKISELRTSGPGGNDDEYVELYNTAGTEIAVQSADGSGGWSLVKRGATCADPPVVIATIPDGTVIPGRGHYLLANTGYSLSGYPAACNCITATPDQLLSAGIQDNRNVGLFNTTNPANFVAANRLDAVGFDAGSGTTCDLLSEGTKLLAPRGSTAEHAFVRKETTGLVQDTNNNAADFWTVSTTPQTGVGDNPAPVLGSPGPENTTSPVVQNGSMGIALVAPSVSPNAAPNRQRDFNVEQCAAQGNLYIRRRIVNNGPLPVTRLRFRVADITTFNSPGYTNPAQADMRVRNSPDETIFAPGRGTVLVQGLDREQPPNQSPPECGGYNTSLAEDTVTFATPLPPGEGVDVVFRLGVNRSGSFRFYFNIETLDTSAPPPPPPAAPSEGPADGPSDGPVVMGAPLRLR